MMTSSCARRQRQGLLATVASLLLVGSGASAVAVDESGGESSYAAAMDPVGGKVRLRASNAARQQRNPFDGTGGPGGKRLTRKEGVIAAGKDAVVDILANLVFAGTGLSAEERTLRNRKSPITDDFSEWELNEFYWRQLSVSYAPAPVPTPAPKKKEPKPANRSPATTIQCAVDESDASSGPETKTVVVTFEYNVEGKGYIGQDVLDVLDYTILEDVADSHCKDGVESGESRARKLRDESWAAARNMARRGLPDVLSIGNDEIMAVQHTTEDEKSRTLQRRRHAAASAQHRVRRLEITSISSDPKDKRLDYCEATHPEAENCATYRGEITVEYTEEGENSSEEEVVDNVRREIKHGMESGEYVDSMNNDLWDNVFEEGNREIINLIYLGPDPDAVVFAPLKVEEIPPSSSRLSSGEKAGIAIGVLAAFIIAIAMLLVCRRKKETEEWKGDPSIATDLDGDEMSYATADYNNLGQRATKQDVHQCRSSLCKNCNPGSSFPSEVCPPVEEESESESESDLIQELARTRSRDVVFIRTRSNKPIGGQVSEIEHGPESNGDVTFV